MIMPLLHSWNFRLIAMITRLRAVLLCVLAVLFMCLPGFSHPEDELCGPDGGMDPELCRALTELDQATSAAVTTDQLLVDTGRTLIGNASFFLKAGVDHILPGGLDHILFVLALFFAVRRFGPLLLQISLFTLAHSASLAMASLGWVNIPASIVEPLIAASIAFVAIENIAIQKLKWWRMLIIFGFGLLHGLGFAGFFMDQSLPEGFFWSSLIGFNIGVELGQISVVLVAGLLFGWFFKHSWYRRIVAIPASLIIAFISAYWAIERVIL